MWYIKKSGKIYIVPFEYDSLQQSLFDLSLGDLLDCTFLRTAFTDCFYPSWQISRRWAVWEHKEGPASGRASSNGKEFSPHPFKKFQYLSLLSGSCLSPTYLFPLSLPFWAFSLLLTLLDWIQFLNLASSHNVTPRSLMEIFFLFLNFSLTLSVLRLMLSVMPRGKFSLW